MPNPFAQLAKLISNLEDLGDKGVEVAAEKIEEKLEAVVQAQYEGGHDPNGATWAPKADGSASHLKKSGDMQRDTKVIAGVKGVSVRIPKPGGWHQDGTSRMPARPLVPGGDSLPPDWQKAAEDGARSVILDGLSK